MRVANREIRTAAKRERIPLWAVADELGISESTMTRWLRHELPDTEREKLLQIIARLRDQEGGE